MSFWTGGNEHTLHFRICQNSIQVGRSGNSMELFAYECRFGFGGDTDILQRKLKIVDNGIEIAEAMLAQTNECICTGVSLLQVGLAASLLVFVYYTHNHLKYRLYVIRRSSVHW